MIKGNLKRCLLVPAILFFLSCKTAVKQQEDKIYSRHLQRHVELTIINTPMPDEKSDMNLLIFNNGNELQKSGIKEIIDSMYDQKQLQPLVLVGIHASEKEEFGLSNLASAANTGSKAEKYNSFVINELQPFIRKKTSIRKFKSVAICGYAMGAVSAFDIAWENADKINKAGIFSASLDYANQVTVNKGDSFNLAIQKIQASRKRPNLQYWIYAGGMPDSMVIENSQILINVIGKKNPAAAAGIQFIADKSATNNMTAWRHHFALFLLWAFGK